MLQKKIITVFMIMILCVGSAYAQAQSQQLQQPPSEAQQLYMEYQQLSQQLQQLQQQAMANEELAKNGEALDSKIAAAMIEKDPSIQSSLDERDNIISQFQTAQQSGDQTKLQSLQIKYQQVNQKIQVVQQKVMQQPEISNDLQVFQEKMMTEMQTINPKATQMINRMEELGQKLSQMQQGGQ